MRLGAEGNIQPCDEEIKTSPVANDPADAHSAPSTIREHNYTGSKIASLILKVEADVQWMLDASKAA